MREPRGDVGVFGHNNFVITERSVEELPPLNNIIIYNVQECPFRRAHQMNSIARLFLMTSVVMLAFPGAVNAVDVIDKAMEDVKEAIEDIESVANNSRSKDEELLQKLNDAVDKGEKARGSLIFEIASLERQKNDLLRIQAILASGLIGALVTAVVAVLGALSSRGRSKAERDLKRLEVLEKSRILQSSGIDIPADIIRLYHASPTSASGTAAGTPRPEGQSGAK